MPRPEPKERLVTPNPIDDDNDGISGHDVPMGSDRHLRSPLGSRPDAAHELTLVKTTADHITGVLTEHQAGRFLDIDGGRRPRRAR